ncbi:P2Y purinoceptor 6 [Rhinoraja longicauda]
MENFSSASPPVPGNGSGGGGGCTYQEKFKNILLPVTYTVVLVMGASLNLAVMVHMWWSARPLTKSAIYMLNLATADALYVCSLPLLIYNYIHMDYWPFGRLACKAVRFLFYANLHGSVLFLTCISLQRYAGICHPLSPWHRRRGPRFAWTVCGLVWAFVLVVCAPTWVFATTGVQRNRTVCYDLSNPESSGRYFPYGMVLTVAGFVVPFLGLLACDCAMMAALGRTDWRLGPANWRRRVRAIKMVAVVAVVFVVSFVPFHITKTMYLAVRARPSIPCHTLQTFAQAYKSTRPLASMNSVLDPILFYLTRKDVRLGARALAQMVNSNQKAKVVRRGTP